LVHGNGTHGVDLRRAVVQPLPARRHPLGGRLRPAATAQGDDAAHRPAPARDLDPFSVSILHRDAFRSDAHDAGHRGTDVDTAHASPPAARTLALFPRAPRLETSGAGDTQGNHSRLLTPWRRSTSSVQRAQSKWTSAWAPPRRCCSRTTTPRAR